MDQHLLDGDGQIVHQQVNWFTVVSISCILPVIVLYLLVLRDVDIKSINVA